MWKRLSIGLKEWDGNTPIKFAVIAFSQISASLSD
jgi:hypothetical protein